MPALIPSQAIVSSTSLHLGKSTIPYARGIKKLVRDITTTNVTDAKVFTFGHDVIDQTTITPGESKTDNPLTLLYNNGSSALFVGLDFRYEPQRRLDRGVASRASALASLLKRRAKG